MVVDSISTYVLGYTSRSLFIQQERVTHLLLLVFLYDLIYGNLQGNIVVAGMTAVLIDPELGGCDRLALRDLGQIEAELLVVSPLVRKIFVFLNWERK